MGASLLALAKSIYYATHSSTPNHFLVVRSKTFFSAFYIFLFMFL